MRSVTWQRTVWRYTWGRTHWRSSSATATNWSAQTVSYIYVTKICQDNGSVSLCSHLEITRVISRTKSGFVYVNATSPDQWPGSVVRENTRTSDPGTTFGPDQLICERYSFLGPPLWRCGLYEEERTHSGSWLHFSPPACSGSTNMG